ncbi:MAG: ribonuclease HII [Pseudomonadota bacterium]
MSRTVICGIDEVGRGPWAGPVCAGAVVLHPDRPIAGLADSKTLSERARTLLAKEIVERAAAWSLGWARPEEVDRLNIRRATHLAMKRADKALFHPYTQALIDGTDVPPGLTGPGRAIVGGDGTIPEISAASILAKVKRDSLMIDLDERYPGYGFASHKGYGTRQHRQALDDLGPCPAHRLSFKPVALVGKQSA